MWERRAEMVVDGSKESEVLPTVEAIEKKTLDVLEISSDYHVDGSEACTSWYCKLSII